MKKIIIVIILTLFGCSQFDINKTPTNVEQILEKFHNSDSPHILVAAHRAQHTKYPENSLAAISHAIESGVDIIEIDVRRTKDGKLVLLHDSKVDRTTNGEGNLIDFTFEQLRKLELEKEPNDLIDHKVPLLKEALKLAQGQIMIDLDIKDTSIKQLVETVHRTKTEDQAVFFDSDFSVLDSVKLLDPSLMVMPRAYSLKDVDSIIIKYSPKVIHIDNSFFTELVVSKIKGSGARVWINALGKPDSIVNSEKVDLGFSPLILGGADIIQTDLPLVLNKFLEEKNLR